MSALVVRCPPGCRCPWKPEEGFICPGAGFISITELACGCWELNLCPLEKQQAHLNSEPSYSPLVKLLRHICISENFPEPILNNAGCKRMMWLFLVWLHRLSPPKPLRCFVCLLGVENLSPWASTMTWGIGPAGAGLKEKNVMLETSAVQSNDSGGCILCSHKCKS